MTTRRDDGGSVTLETVIIVPGLLLLLSLLIYGGRVMTASSSVTQAANEAARSASIARTAGQARASASTSAVATLARQGLQCESTTVDVDTSGFLVPVGQPASIRATIRCRVRVGDLLLPGVPGTHDVEASSVSPLDTYRGRT